MTNTSATLLEKNVEQALEKFESLLNKEGTQALKNHWSEIKTVLSLPTAVTTQGGPGNPDCQHQGC